MKLLREYIGKILNAQSDLVIPPPPPKHFRIKELSVIQKQYYNRYNPDSIQDSLDSIVDTFDNFLMSAGIRSQKDLLEQLKNETLPIIHMHKNYFNSLRPKDLAHKHNIDFKSDFLESAQSPSYPSGHATQAYYVAFKLIKLYPGLKTELLELANMISQARIDRGVHFPSDIEAGKILALKMVS